MSHYSEERRANADSYSRDMKQRVSRDHYHDGHVIEDSYEKPRRKFWGKKNRARSHRNHYQSSRNLDHSDYSYSDDDWDYHNHNHRSRRHVY